jgi:hypothetical protein
MLLLYVLHVLPVPSITLCAGVVFIRIAFSLLRKFFFCLIFYFIVTSLLPFPLHCYLPPPAPHYLNGPEKVTLCYGTPPSRGQEAVKCLQAAESASKLYKQAPKKALGYFIESLWDPK